MAAEKRNGSEPMVDKPNPLPLAGRMPAASSIRSGQKVRTCLPALPVRRGLGRRTDVHLRLVQRTDGDMFEMRSRKHLLLARV